MLFDLADQIARHPFQIGEDRIADAASRTVENIVLEGYHLSFWVDHASREVRISEIVRI